MSSNKRLFESVVHVNTASKVKLEHKTNTLQQIFPNHTHKPYK